MPPDEIAKDAKMSPFVVRKTQTATRYLTLSQIKTFVNKLLKIDIDLKSKSIDADEALKNYIVFLGSLKD
jgi:DNA polymerase III delta subunit